MTTKPDNVPRPPCYVELHKTHSRPIIGLFRAVSFLETFDYRNPRFYQRLGFLPSGPRRAGHCVGLHNHESEPETAPALRLAQSNSPSAPFTSRLVAPVKGSVNF
jgi:hypothetical protein